jgi:copper resistance protein C
MKIGIFGIAAATAAATLLTASPAFAHARLVSSNPAANAAVAAPRTITLTFSDKVVPAFSSFEVVMEGHDMKVPVSTPSARTGRGSPETCRAG